MFGITLDDKLDFLIIILKIFTNVQNFCNMNVTTLYFRTV